MKFSDDLVSRTKEEFKKKGKEMDDDEAQEALKSMAGLFEILWEMSVKDTKRKNRLKLEPEVVDVDIRDYAKYLLREGADIEKRELLGCLKTRILLANKEITLVSDSQ